jgi:hypothetical protein
MITGELKGPIVKINLLHQAAGFPSERIRFPLHALEYSSSCISEIEQSTRRLLESQFALCPYVSPAQLKSMSDSILLQHHGFHCGIAITISRFVHVQSPKQSKYSVSPEFELKTTRRNYNTLVIGCCMWLVKKKIRIQVVYRLTCG